MQTINSTESRLANSQANNQSSASMHKSNIKFVSDSPITDPGQSNKVCSVWLQTSNTRVNFYVIFHHSPQSSCVVWWYRWSLFITLTETLYTNHLFLSLHIFFRYLSTVTSLLYRRHCTTTRVWCQQVECYHVTWQTIRVIVSYSSRDMSELSRSFCDTHARDWYDGDVHTL